MARVPCRTSKKGEENETFSSCETYQGQYAGKHSSPFYHQPQSIIGVRAPVVGKTKLLLKIFVFTE